jgi:type I restriction enzyme, R subunit
VKPESNFEHLQEIDGALASLGGFAERYFVDDANTALIKTRQFAERLAIVVADRASIEVSGRSEFVDILRRLRSDGVVPRDVLDMMHTLRKQGNQAVHALDGERQAAFDAIRLCHRLGVWFRSTVTNQPGLTQAFVPPRARANEAEALKAQIEDYMAKLNASESERRRLAILAAEAAEARLSAEERARLAEEERQVMEQLTLDAEARASVEVSKADASAFIAAAQASGQTLDIDERDTRLLVDAQLRAVGWEVDSEDLKHAKGARPEKSKNRAIAEWPTASGPCDYALFLGTSLVGVVEAKRKRTNVPAALDEQSHRYARDVVQDVSFTFAGGPWGDVRVPFLFAANGRGYYPQLATQSGIWFRDARRGTRYQIGRAHV